MRTDEFLGRLQGVKPTGERQWIALCPGHADTNPSLSIKEADDNILLHCFAGCKTEDILKSLHLNPPDLYLNSHQPRLQGGREHTPKAAEKYNSAGRVIEAVYNYTGVNGEPFQVVRYRNPKKFSQRRPDGKGDYLEGRGDIVPTLYRQDELPQAIANNSTIFITEGEKDCDRLRGLALVATTCLGGAGKWRDSYGEALRGADVVILPDKDEVGLKHGQQVAASLRGMAKSVKVLELPGECKDSSDWLDNGNDIEQLKQLVDAYPDYEPTPEAKFNEVYAPGFILRDGTIGEMVIDAERGERTFVLRVPAGAITKVREYSSDNTIYKPMIGGLAGQTVSFASDATEYGSLGSLLAEVRDFIHRYVELPANFEAIAALYILLSWVYEPLPTLPYLRALGDYGTGKTRFLEVIGAIAFRAIRAAGATTPSPIFRIIDIYRGSLVLDEADFNRSDAVAEIVKILNSGYKPGSPVLRSEPTNNKKWEPHSYNVFGPKILATRKRWADRALESRCLTWEAEGLTRDDIPLVLGPRFKTEASALGCKLLGFRLDYLPQVIALNLEDARPAGNLEPRLQEILLPLKAIAQGDTALEATLDEFILGMQDELEEDRRNSLPALVLEAILSIREGGGELSVKAITERLNEGDQVKEHLERPDRGITARRVGATVKGLGLRTRRGTSTRGFVIQGDNRRIAILCRRYGFLIPPNNVPNVPFVSDTFRKDVPPLGVDVPPLGVDVPPLPGIKSSESGTYGTYGTSFQGVENVTGAAASGLPCYKAPGICTLRTDASKPFQCGESPGRCPFIAPPEGT